MCIPLIVMGVGMAVSMAATASAFDPHEQHLFMSKQRQILNK